MAFSFARPARSAALRLAGSPLAYPRPLRLRVAARRPRAAPVRPAVALKGDRTALGILAIVASTISFPMSDLAAQSLMVSLPPVEVAWLRYVVFFLAALPLLARGRGVLRSVRPGLQLLRGTTSAGATLAAIVAFKYLAVPETTAIGFVAPVMVTALAMLVLKEKVGLRRWSAALVALAGVVIIVQPGGDSCRLAALIPLAGAAVSAVTVICTRLNTADSAGTTVLYSTAIGTAVLSVLTAFDWVTPSAHDLRIALIVGAFGALGSFLQVIAYRLAPASALSPFTYLQLIWASGLSFLVLGTVPGLSMAFGAAIIAASAIYTAYRERVRGVVA